MVLTVLLVSVTAFKPGLFRELNGQNDHSVLSEAFSSDCQWPFKGVVRGYRWIGTLTKGFRRWEIR